MAAIVVVLFHAFPYGPFFWGWSGVELFFVLSGFLITTIILSQGDRPHFLRSFYFRRICRIWPVYYLTLAVVLLLNHLSPVGSPTAGLATHLCFLQNCQRYLGQPVPGFIGTFWPSWSVAVEEQFYLFWPLLLPLLGRRGVPIFAVGLLVTSWLGRALLVSRFELLVTRGDGLALGCLLAWLLDGQGQPRRRMLARACVPFAAAVGCLYVAWFLTPFYPSHAPIWASAQFTGFSLMFFALIGVCVLYSGSFWLGPLRSSLLRWFGTVSYALYLFHLPLLTYPRGILPRLGVHSSILQNTVIWLLIVLLPGASWYLFEQPILRWKESLLHAPSEANAVVSTASPAASLTAAPGE